MNVRLYKARNRLHMIKNRLRYPPPFYKKVGSISAVVNRANGITENLKNISVSYAKRWGVGSGQ